MIDDPSLSTYEKIWLEAWMNVALSSSCTEMGSPSKWADRCLEDFKSRRHTIFDDPRKAESFS